jgi:hypothetical protein
MDCRAENGAYLTLMNEFQIVFLECSELRQLSDHFRERLCHNKESIFFSVSRSARKGAGKCFMPMFIRPPFYSDSLISCFKYSTERRTSSIIVRLGRGS